MPPKANNPRASHNSTPGYIALDSNQWNAVLDSVSDPISVHSVTGEVVWANRTLCDVYAKPLAQLIGLSCDQAFDTEGAGTSNDKSAGDSQPQCEVTVRQRLWSVTITPLSGEEKTVGFVRQMHDITEQRRARQQLRDAEKFASLGQMLFGIAHNIGTPLNIISGYSEYLLMRTKPEEQGHKELSAILDQTKRITHLLSEALDIVRPGQKPPSAIAAKELLADVLSLAAHYFRKTEVSVQLTCGMGLPLIYGEAPQLRQAFFSLVLNASQSVGNGGRLEVVVAESQEVPGFLSVSLWGTEGSGQAHDFSHSFQSFVEGSNEGVASGLGLSLARKVLDATGAMVAFDGSEGRGVSVVVYLPASRSRSL